MDVNHRGETLSASEILQDSLRFDSVLLLWLSPEAGIKPGSAPLKL